MVWFAIGILLALLAMMPIRVLIAYSLQGLSIKLRVGFLTFSILPRKAKVIPKKKDKPEEPAAAETKPEEKSGQKQKIDIDAYLRLLKMVLDLLMRLRSKVVMERFRFLLVLAGDDPSDLALLYGRLQGVAAVLLGQIEDAFHIKKRDVAIECDFTADKTVLDGFVDISISFIRLLFLSAKHGTKILKEYFALINYKKAVQ